MTSSRRISAIRLAVSTRVSSVDWRTPGRISFHHRVEHEVTGEADKQRVHQENPQPQAHQLLLRAVAVAEAAMGLDRFGVGRHRRSLRAGF